MDTAIPATLAGGWVPFAVLAYRTRTFSRSEPRFSLAPGLPLSGTAILRLPERYLLSKANDTGTKTDFLWKTLGRIDTYIGTTNVKAALIVAFDTFLLGGLLLKAPDILTPLKAAPVAHTWALWFIATIGVASVASLWITLSVVQPFLTSNKRPGEYHSRIFFGDISEVKDAGAFLTQVRDSGADEMLDDLAQQVHIVATIACTKFTRLRWVTRVAVFAQIPVLLALLLLALFATP